MPHVILSCSPFYSSCHDRAGLEGLTAGLSPFAPSLVLKDCISSPPSHLPTIANCIGVSPSMLSRSPTLSVTFSFAFSCFYDLFAIIGCLSVSEPISVERVSSGPYVHVISVRCSQRSRRRCWWIFRRQSVPPKSNRSPL